MKAGPKSGSSFSNTNSVPSSTASTDYGVHTTLETAQSKVSSCDIFNVTESKGTCSSVLVQAEHTSKECSDKETLGRNLTGDSTQKEEWGSCDEEFMRDVFKELDNLEGRKVSTTNVLAIQNSKEPKNECPSTKIDGKFMDKCSGAMKQHFQKSSDTTARTPCQIPLTNSTSHIRPSDTPTRTECISHIAPITLLPSGSIRLPASRQTFKATEKSMSISSVSTKSCTGLPMSPIKKQENSSPTVKKIVKETPPSSVKATSPGMFDTPNSECIRNNDGQFRTPNTSKWIVHKSLCSSSCHSTVCTPQNSSLDRVILASGGKVTPPLCNCGRRTKRRTVCTPGPNEGRPFYVCPNGSGSNRKKGCGFFKWECLITPSTDGTTEGRSSSEYKLIQSEYIE